MAKETVYRFEYLGSQIRCVGAREEYYGDETDLIEDVIAWYVVVLGALACYGWWILWV